jgi:guanyl-specific ribonuclease Sa
MLYGGELANAEWDRATGQLLGGMAIGGAGKILQAMKLPLRVAAQARAEVVLSRLPHLHERQREILEESIYRATLGRPRFLGHDGTTFDNDGRDGTMTLPPAAPGYYQEWTVQENGAKRAEGRLVIGGPRDAPDIIYFSTDHFVTMTKVYP